MSGWTTCWLSKYYLWIDIRVKRVYMRWIRLLIHLYINNIFIHFNLLKRYFVYFIIFLPGVLEMLRVLWYEPANFSKNNLRFLAATHH